MEQYLYKGLAFPFTQEWYEDRHHAPHKEQPVHRPRMEKVADFACQAIDTFNYGSVVDFGAGDGGMLELIRERAGDIDLTHTRMWGYDLQPSNVEYARHHRGVDVKYRDFTDEDLLWGDLIVTTECLEHLEDPHELVRRISENARAVIASSPSQETPESHDACHAWVWDMEGYAQMFKSAGFSIVDHVELHGGYDFQVLFAAKP